MDTLITLIRWPEYLVVAYLGGSALYFLIFAIASHLYRERTRGQRLRPSRVAILLPSYQEDAVILETARAAGEHISAHHEVETLVLADSLQPATVAQLKTGPARVLEVSFENSTKAKSIRKGLEVVDPGVDYILVLDADNVMAPGCVDALVEQLQSGFRVVQGQRTAKNDNTDFAVLDGLSEATNNAIFRTGHRVLGLSAALIGSGFACEAPLFRELMDRAEAVGGFDKELELFLLEQGITIGYARKAVILDEKIQKADAFVNQRRRWLSAQFIYFGRNIGRGLRLLLTRGRIDYFDKLIQFILPPRILTLGATGLMAVVYLLLSIWWPFGLVALWWTGAFLATAIAIAISLPARTYSLKTLKSLAQLPLGFWLTLKALFKLKGANKKFIHTEHGIDEHS